MNEGRRKRDRVILRQKRMILLTLLCDSKFQATLQESIRSKMKSHEHTHLVALRIMIGVALVQVLKAFRKEATSE